MNIETLREQYNELKKMEDTDDGIFEFKEALLESNENDILEFHLEILNDREDSYLNRDIFSFFSDRKDTEKVGNFIHKKIQSDFDDITLLADLIQILGHLRDKNTIEVAMKYIKSEAKELRYRSIIVLGWVGSASELDVLNDRLLNDKDGELRGYAATAMRQIFFNNSKTKKMILSYLNNAIQNEDDEDAVKGIIITAQDILKKKLGLKESQYGDVTGDIIVAKSKTINALGE